MQKQFHLIHYFLSSRSNKILISKINKEIYFIKLSLKYQFTLIQNLYIRISREDK